jgi:hypothetical protein
MIAPPTVVLNWIGSFKYKWAKRIALTGGQVLIHGDGVGGGRDGLERSIAQEEDGRRKTEAVATPI